MSIRREKKSSSGGWMLLAAAIGAGIGFAATKLIDVFSEEKQKQKSKIKNPIQAQSKIQVTKTTIDNYDNLQELMVCPITQQIMSDPFILTPCGHSFEKEFIENWLQKNGQCPLCKAKVTKMT